MTLYLRCELTEYSGVFSWVCEGLQECCPCRTLSDHAGSSCLPAVFCLDPSNQESVERVGRVQIFTTPSEQSFTIILTFLCVCVCAWVYVQVYVCAGEHEHDDMCIHFFFYNVAVVFSCATVCTCVWLSFWLPQYISPFFLMCCVQLSLC